MKAADTNGHDERDSIRSRFVEEVVVVDVLVGGVHVDEVRASMVLGLVAGSFVGVMCTCTK